MMSSKWKNRLWDVLALVATMGVVAGLLALNATQFDETEINTLSGVLIYQLIELGARWRQG